jgi:hypothetical protein
MVSEAQKRAKKVYDKKTTQFFFRLRNDADADVIARLMSVTSKTGYIRYLIRKDINGEK